MSTPLHLRDGGHERVITGRMAAMIRRLLQHEVEILKHERGAVEIGFDGLRIYARLQRPLEGGQTVA